MPIISRVAYFLGEIFLATEMPVVLFVVFPAASVAVYVTTVVPNAKADPGLLVLVSRTEQLSETIGAVHVTMA